MKKKLSSAAVLLFSGIFSSAIWAFSSKDIISPAPGTWSNVQALVLNNTQGAELYYSLTGTDPLISGFSYDGPVVIDDTGTINLNITAIEKNGSRSDFSIEYTVAPKDALELEQQQAEFIYRITANPVLKYLSGTELVLPKGFKYSMDKNAEPYLDCTPISIDGLNLYRSYIPVTIGKDDLKYYFVLHVLESDQKELASGFKGQKDIPFKIVDWETFVFTGSKLIYQIDDGMWSADTEPVILDRSVAHSISWQSMAYEFGNPVSVFILPAKPSVVKKVEKNGSVLYSIPENYRYQISFPEKKELYNSILIDTFPGAELSMPVSLEVYFDGIKVGTFTDELCIDKMPPVPPVISSSSDGVFTRSEVEVSIANSLDTKIFYTLSHPVEFDAVDQMSEFDFEGKCTFPDYVEYEGQNISLKSSHGKVTYYKVRAFSQDYYGNTSAVSEYEVVVDQYNYYLDQSVSDKNADGTYVHPFNSLEQAAAAINSNRFTKLHVIGPLTVSEENIIISSDCLIYGVDSHILFTDSASVFVQNASVEFQNFIIEKNQQKDSSKRMFVSEGGSLAFNSCEIIALFIEDGILFDSKYSSLSLIDSGVTVQGSSYACCVSGMGLELFAQNVRFTSVSSTSVNLSMHGGKADISSCLFSVIGTMGRCAEFTESEVSLKDSRFTGNISGSKKNLKPVWNDVNTRYLEFSGNTQEGF